MDTNASLATKTTTNNRKMNLSFKISKFSLLLYVYIIAVYYGSTSTTNKLVTFAQVQPNPDAVITTVTNNNNTNNDPPSQEALLKQPERLTVVAPKYLRPQSDYFILLTLANSQAPATVDLQLIGARDSNREQTEARSILLQSGETQTVKIPIGPDWPAAEYFLQVQAQATDKSWQFQRETPVYYHQKSLSALIQTDKAIYKPGDLVQFRAIFLNENTAPVSLKDEINVVVSDPKKNLVRQWTAQSNWRGLLSLELPLSGDPMLGEWQIQFDVRGQQFTKRFSVQEYVLPTFDVQVQLPPYATYNKSNIVATVRATYTYGKPVGGHVTLTVQPLIRFYNLDTRPLEQDQYRARLQGGSADFRVDLARHLRDERQRLGGGGGGGDLFEREVEFFALVEEDLTGRKYNRTAVMKIHDKEIKIERLNAATFKPGLSGLQQYKVAHQDDTPVEDHGHQVLLEYTHYGVVLDSIKLRPVGGLIEHELIVPAKVRRQTVNRLGRLIADPDSEQEVVPNYVDVKAQYKGQTHYLGSLAGFTSDSGQYLQISLPQVQKRASNGGSSTSGNLKQQRVNIGDTLKIRLKSTEKLSQQVNCQGLARGQIIWASSQEGKNRSELELEVQVDQRMAPESQVVCFYVRPENKELIVDKTWLSVGGLMRNFVKLSPSREEAKPGQSVDVDVFTKPSSLVGLAAIDQSVLLLKSGNNIDSKQVLDDNRKYAGPTDSEMDGIEARSAQELFDAANLIVITNNLVKSNFVPVLYLDGPMMSPQLAGGRAGKLIRLESEILQNNSLQPPEFHLKDRDSIRIRSVFPESWLWLNGTADSSGRLNFEGKIPDTITSWQLSAFSLNEAHGLGLADNSKNPTTIRVFRPFFIKMNLPYSIIRGETVSLQAVIFNYSKRPMQARVTMDNQRGEFEFVQAGSEMDSKTNNNNGNNNNNNNNTRTNESRLIRVPAQDGVSVSFLVRPLKLGYLDVKLVAQGEGVGDGVLRKLLVKPEGQVQHFNKAMLIQLPLQAAAAAADNESATSSSSFSRNLFKRNVSIEVPANAVRDSRKIQVSLIGDILGAGLANVDDLLRLPYGCGEQNMINLVPNIVLYNYLLETRRLRDAQRDRAKRNIETGYQRQLNYKRPDGSFSAFGTSDAQGSVWLTSYVLKTFQQAKQIITVDEEILRLAANFVTRSAREDGSFEEVGMLHDKRLTSASSSESSVYLTAYILISLLEQQPNQQQQQQQLVEREVIERGLNYLESQLDRSKVTSYDLAILSYALHLGGRQDSAQRAYDKLWERANQHDDQTWWPVGQSAAGMSLDLESGNTRSSANLLGSPEVETFSVTGGGNRTTAAQPPPPPLRPPAVQTKQSAHLFTPDSLAIEASSWALLSAVRRGDLERALPIVRWLIGQQNSHGGFASTQDTVLAIQALASFAQATLGGAAAARGTQTPGANMEVEFLYPRGRKSSSQFRRTNTDQLSVNPSNSLVLQQIQLGNDEQINVDDISWIQVQASGQGVAVVQLSWQYNLQVSAEEPAFYLNPQLDKSSTINYLQLSVCTFYKDNDQTVASSNMAVMEVELPSGYVADAEALDSLKRQKSIKRVDLDEDETKVIIYLDKVTRNDELCLTVPAHRSTKVANNRPVPVTIYDYYDRTKAARIFYEPLEANTCDICETDTCTKQCQEAKFRQQPSARLITNDNTGLNHQLTDRNARLQAQNTPDDLRNKNTNANNNNKSHNIPFNVTLPLAKDLLPLTPVLTAFKEKLNQYHN